jgi:hemerythrin-like domain-containing protein
MLKSIETGASTPPQEEDALSLLLGCHQRIRHFSDVAWRLAESPQAPDLDRADAARAVLRYYTIALPLHEADENESLYPRLKSVLPPGELAEANQAMVDQHVGIDVAVAELIPMWREIEWNPSVQEGLSERLRNCTIRLRELWNVHLALEEEQVVPAMRRYLSEADLLAVQQEMRLRRE